ncbi:MAG: 23S rRNA (pseudouridine(1915)-N(3))-methyltransferase RlmH [Nanoarchaeota archaeon]|nr:23S rRNA (pseudouridine(1915)-N(3))-methyltransferase RlmH [Nanoarchaeota archaeon]
MKIKIICVGKVKNKNLITEIDDLIKRISRFEIVYLKEVKDKNIDIIKKKEFDLIKPYLQSSNFNVLLWEYGREFSTRDFYDKFVKIDGTIVFIITGAYGPSEDLKKEVNMFLSLSKMTFTHEQALYMLTEQLYRVECFEKNIPYTK